MREPLHEYMRPAIVQFMLFPELISGSRPLVDPLLTILRDPSSQNSCARCWTWVTSSTAAARP
jgi:hypothetical protein